MWRSLWTRRRGEGEAVAAATVNGDDGSARPFMRESEGEGEGAKEREGSIQTAAEGNHGVALAGGRQSGKLVAWRPCARRRAHAPVLLTRGRGRLAVPVGWAGLLGRWARPAAQCQAAGNPGKLFSIFVFFSIF